MYCIVDDILKYLGHIEDKRQKMSDAEVITTVLLSAITFAGNIEKTRKILQYCGMIPDMLSRSRLNRRIHSLSQVLEEFFGCLAGIFKQANDSSHYIIDSFPVALCDNMRISRCRLVQSEEYRGRIASKRRYFYGVRVHVLATADGIPVEVVFLPGSAHDSRAFDTMSFDLAADSTVYADSAYTHYDTEDVLLEACGITFSPLRKKVSTRQDDLPERLFKSLVRKRIETVFSCITTLMPRKIHATTLKGFLLKVYCFVVGFAIDTAVGN